MSSRPDPAFRAWLRDHLAEDPALVEWPREILVRGPRGDVPGLWDPHNALLVLYDVSAAGLAAPEFAAVGAAAGGGDDLCTRLLVFARAGEDAAWDGLGFGREGVLPGFWRDGSAAIIRARVVAGRAASAEPPPDAPQPPGREPWPEGWSTRPADPGDAEEIRDLLATVFPAYPIPEDPGSVRYALAGGLVHGRVAVDPDGVVAAYASAEFQPGGGAAEITDCATAPRHRGRGLMSRIVAELRADLVTDYGQPWAYALVRDDSPAMGAVLASGGWRRSGRMVGHYRVGEAWVSAGIWVAGPAADDPQPPGPGTS